MLLQRKMEKINYTNNELPSLVISYEGEIIGYNKALSNIYETIEKSKNIENLLDKDTSFFLREIIAEAKEGNIKTTKKILLSKFSENQICEIETLSINGKKNCLKIIFNFLERKVEEDILSIIEIVKLTYPFTFISKNNLQKEINRLDVSFYIKYVSGRYSIVNKKFAKLFNLETFQIEGSSKVFDTKKYSIIECCIFDGDNPIAIIGFSEKNNFPYNNRSNNTLIAIDEISKPFFIIKEGIIIDYNLKIKEALNINNEIDILKKEINEIFSQKVCDKIEDTIGKQLDEPQSFAININGEEIQLRIKLIEDNEDKKYLISFDNKQKNIKLSGKSKMYDVIMHNSSEPILIYDTENLKFIDINKAAQKLYGYKKEEFLELDLTDLYTPEDIQTLLQSSNSTIVEGQYTGPWRHKRKDGKLILVEVNKFGIQYENKSAQINIIRDVTQKVEENKEMQLLKAAFKYSGDIIITADAGGVITKVNDNAIEKLGYQKEFLEGTSFSAIVSDEERAKVNTEIFNSASSETFSISTFIKKSNENLIEAELLATPIINYSGDVESFSIIIKLETLSDNQLSTVTEDIQIVKEKSGVDKEFLAHLFHEILTPINVILGFAQEINENTEAPTEEQKEISEIIKENRKLLFSLMDTVIEFTGMLGSDVKMRIERVVFVEVLDEIQFALKEDLEKKSKEIGFGKISSSLSFYTDRQKFINLLTTFISITTSLIESKKIYISANSYDENFAIIGFKDKTTTISSSLIEKLVKLFQSDEDAVRKLYGISRLKMKLLKKIIEVLGIKLETISNGKDVPDFAFLVPLTYSKETATSDIGEVENSWNEIANAKKLEAEVSSKSEEDNLISAKSILEVKEEIKINKDSLSENTNRNNLKVEKMDKLNSSKWSEENLSSMSCLYVEDQVDSQILFKIQMKDLKQMNFAASFEEALPLLEENNYNFIIMDINLQGEYNGLDALKIIRTMENYRSTPIIASTAYVLPGDREKFLEFGFSDFISKPVMRNKILEVLKRIF